MARVSLAPQIPPETVQLAAILPPKPEVSEAPSSNPTPQPESTPINLSQWTHKPNLFLVSASHLLKSGWATERIAAMLRAAPDELLPPFPGSLLDVGYRTMHVTDHDCETLARSRSVPIWHFFRNIASPRALAQQYPDVLKVAQHYGGVFLDASAPDRLMTIAHFDIFSLEAFHQALLETTKRLFAFPPHISSVYVSRDTILRSMTHSA